MKFVKKSTAFIMAGLLAAGVGFVAVTSNMTPAAQAQSRNAKQVVDQAKRDGVIGETAGGYLAVVGGQASPEVVNAMNEINIGRKSVYNRLAREQGVSIEIVAAMTGEKQLAKASLGEKIMTKSGDWVTVK